MDAASKSGSTATTAASASALRIFHPLSDSHVDFDGVPGGHGLPTCGPGVDDSIADFSNTGPAVDIYAPGVCIETITLSDSDDVVTPSGSSLAAAHVAGAASVYMACHVNATPSEVRAALLDSAEIVQTGRSAIPMVSIYPFCFADTDAKP